MMAFFQTRASTLLSSVRLGFNGASILTSKKPQPFFSGTKYSRSHVISNSTLTTIAKVSHPRNKTWREILGELRKYPLEYATIPAVAAFVGLSTNWMGVKMLFYPIDYKGTSWWRAPGVPYGVFGWEGVVPCKTEKMADRLVHIVTGRLLTVEEAFGRIDPHKLTKILIPIVEAELLQEKYGEWWVRVLHPFLPVLLTRVVSNLQRDIESILDLKSVVLSAFVRDKEVLVELFQKVGRVELDFLVESGLGFGFILGLGQMLAWVMKPRAWTLPVAGALVGYVTNLIAIKLLFDPAEPVQVGPIVVQGLFESRQVEVSDEFGNFMAHRVLNPGRLLESLARDGDEGELHSFLRTQLPYPVPKFILSAAVRAIAKAAENPKEYPDLHNYMASALDVESTLAHRLKLMSPTDFEDLLHPVFQEDEAILIAVGGVLGAAAGLLQTRLGWGGPGATVKAVFTLLTVSVSSWGYFFFKEFVESPEELVIEENEVIVRPVVNTRRRNTLIKVQPEVIPPWMDFGDRYQ
mmetsp:Transcript_18918/g.39204  ORF Transcript_18918/g.39204 Transcript_18918/m.39204 type:complete len:521 (+) Transcript_18918:247-1809(+)